MDLPPPPALASALERLNDAQRDAVLDTSRALLILAGAGSGKTQTLTTKIARMIRCLGVPSGSILAMTFSNKAAREMRERASVISGVEAGDMHIGTFHGICAHVLRVFLGNRDFTIIDAAKSGRLLKEICKGLCPTTASADALDRATGLARKAIDAWKNDGLSCEEVPHQAKEADRRSLTAYRLYTKHCRSKNQVDFGDLLLMVRDALRDDPELRAIVNAKWRHVLVDEFQDTNAVQMQLVKLLAPPGSPDHTVTVVGDDYQSIHGWRGAVVQNILGFEAHYPGARVVQLDVNYRSTATIVRASQSVIAKNPRQRHKDMRADASRGPGAADVEARVVVRKAANEAAEAEFVAACIREHAQASGDEAAAYDGTAVLYRTHAYSLAFEQALSRARIPYVIHGAKGFYGRAEIKDLMAYMRLATDPKNDEAFARVANVPRRGIGAATMDGLERSASEHGVSVFEAAGESVHKGVRGFVSLLRLLGELREEPPAELLRHVLDATGYLARMLDGADKEGRIELVEDVDALASVLRGYGGTTRDFLDDLDIGEGDDDGEKKRVGVRLMTLHTSKGLEFDRVFVVGATEGMLPHCMATRENPWGAEEERRLFYVGMTRARQWLCITRPGVRASRNRGEPPSRAEPSRFIGEIDPDCVESGRA